MHIRWGRLFGRRIWWMIFAVFALSLILVVEFLIFSASAPKATEKSQVSKQIIYPKSISSNVLFLGNSFWGRNINDWSKASPLKYAYPFSRLNEFNRDNYDAWISGLECPISSKVDPTSAEQEAALQFNCRPEYLPEAAKWFTAFTLANNHTDNQGVAGFEETQQQLEKNGIQYFGNYDPTVIDDACEIIALPIKVKNSNDKTITGSLPVAMCAYHGVFQIPSSAAAAEIAKYSPYMPVIVMPHMGAEYKSSSDQIKTDFYRSLIDNGADMVLGDHPHWIQGTESYNGHLIVYSMGNFMFDQQDTTEVTRSAAINVQISATSKDSNNLRKWIVLGGVCYQYKDDCLDQVKKQNLEKLDFTYKFSVIGTNDSQKITKPATSEQTTAILQRLNWQSTMQNLQPPYSNL